MKLTVLYGTETGNCRDLAHKVAKKGEKNGVEADVIDLAQYSVEQLAALDHPFVVIISTWDDGVPPPDAADFCEALEKADVSLAGKKYTVLALGDNDYPLYCQCGKQVDADLARLGAEPILPRTDLGSEFMVSYIGWSKKFWQALAGIYGDKEYSI